MRVWNERGLKGWLDLRWLSSCFLKSSSFSNFSQPGQKNLTREPAYCLVGVLYLLNGRAIDFGLGGDIALEAYK